MLAALRPQRSCHLLTRSTISRLLENHLEPCYSIQYCRHISFSDSPLNLLLKKQLNFQYINRSCHKQPQIKVNVNFKRASLPDAREGSYGSRFHPPSQIEMAEERIKDSLSLHTLLTHEEWAKVKTSLMDELAILTEVNFSSIIMNCLLILNKVDEAHAFMCYLQEANIEVNFLAHLKYMDLCGRNVEQCGQEVILRSFKKVKSFMDASPVMDLKRAEHMIQGLCATDQWGLSLDYLKKVPCKPNMLIKNSLACAAIRNSNELLVWEILTKWLRTDESPSNRVFKEIFMHALRLGFRNKKKSEVFLMKVLDYIRWKRCIVSEDVVKVVEQVFQRHSSKWKISYTKVSRNGECESCKRSLRVIDFTEEDFTYLKDSFLEKSLKKSDLFINTTEEEFNQYIRFINNNKPFDIVLDGLNAAHSFQSKKNPKKLALQLLRVVESLSEPPKRLLVLGKYHMRFWPNFIMEKIRRKAKLFLTNNISQDDPFMVYAALLSGPNAKILSADLMRDHMSRLDDPVLIQHFKRWQQTHQIYMNVDCNNELHFVKPLKHSINVQGSMEDGWHIPFDDNIALDPYEELNNWICIQKME